MRGAMAGWIALAALVAACGAEPGIVGRWTGQDADGNRMTFDFREGGGADWIVQVAEAAPETISMRYETDASVTPHAIDLTDFEGGPLEGYTMAGIYELTGDDAFRLDLEPVRNDAEADSVRPSTFTAEAVTFTRVEAGE